MGASDDPYQRDMLEYYKMGNGPFYVFYRPYHLCHVEAMQSVAEAVLDETPLLQPTYGFRTNVIAYAKTDLHAGDSCDGIGGYTCYGMIENTPRWDHRRTSMCLASMSCSLATSHGTSESRLKISSKCRAIGKISNCTRMHCKPR